MSEETTSYNDSSRKEDVNKKGKTSDYMKDALSKDVKSAKEKK